MTFKPVFEAGEMARSHKTSMYYPSSPFRSFRGGLLGGGNYLALVLSEQSQGAFVNSHNQGQVIQWVTKWGNHMDFKLSIAARFAPGTLLH